VLLPFDADQGERVAQVVARAAAAIECWLAEGIVAAMDEFNRSLPTDESPKESTA